MAQREDLGEGSLAPLVPCVDPIKQLPILVLLPHERCNCRCIMCDVWQIKKGREIPPERVAQWLPEWQALGVERVILGGGEALLHSHIWELCQLLSSAGIGITLLSTGILLKRSAAQLVRYCDDIVVSLDGPGGVHNGIRNVPRAYERLVEGVAAVKSENEEIWVSGRCTVQRQNFRHLRETVAAAQAAALDRISFLAADVSTEAFNRPGGWEPDRIRDVALGEEDLRDLAAELEALEHDCAAEFASGYIAESPGKLRRRLYQYFEALAGRGDFDPVQCNAPWVSTVIEADGAVRPCYFHRPLGNVIETGNLSGVLNSADALSWRKDLDTRRNTICRKCVCSLALRQSATLNEAVSGR